MAEDTMTYTTEPTEEQLAEADAAVATAEADLAKLLNEQATLPAKLHAATAADEMVRLEHKVDIMPVYIRAARLVLVQARQRQAELRIAQHAARVRPLGEEALELDKQVVELQKRRNRAKADWYGVQAAERDARMHLGALKQEEARLRAESQQSVAPVVRSGWQAPRHEA